MENSIILNTHYLLTTDSSPEIDQLAATFCGKVVKTQPKVIDNETYVYVAGDITICSPDLLNRKNTLVISDLSSNLDKIKVSCQIINLGMVPINVCNMGILIPKLFDSDLFNQIENQHQFQNLTESNKGGSALRTGIYITKVKQHDNKSLWFNLLRCSSNFTGPTDNFKSSDREVIESITKVAQPFFKRKFTLNHVLAQIYHNRKATDDHRESKAVIKAHSDKTKDMPNHAVIAFTTFYNSNDYMGKARKGTFDRFYKNTSVLSQLHFKLKDSAIQAGISLPKNFTVTLYPNSVFIIPLSTNRIYTHQIKPPTLPVGKFPTRMGYVVRCSKTTAVFHKERTYIATGKDKSKMIELEPMTNDDMKTIKDLYQQENKGIKRVDYGEVYFSMNTGDYIKPLHD